MERRSKFDTRPTADQVTIASEQQLQSFSAFLSGNPYKTLWEMHFPLQYGDFTLSDFTHKEVAALVSMCKDFIRNLQVNPDSADLFYGMTSHGHRVFEIVNTAGQGENTVWLASRSIRITSSVAHQVLHFATEEGKRSFLQKHLWSIKKEDMESKGKIKGIAHGHKYEKAGILAYQEYRRVFDSTVQVLDTVGLTFREDYPEFGCSPDGVAYSRFNPPRLVEVKCPLTLKFSSPEDFENVLSSKQRAAFCLRRDSMGNIGLKKEHPYYYQIQFSLSILGMDEADLVIYTLKGFMVLTIKWDMQWWEDNVEKLKKLHRTLIVPEYFLIRTPRGLLPIEVDCNEEWEE